ncbi:MAG TPA: LytTR family DNA-binding domain-containing protein [Gemmatimonadaceae bacterium]|nr:LytTR family DNA-binding domain-containing protein [Gemmatimonadaceae bacterium]
MPASPIRVVAVDDEPLALAGLRGLLARDPEMDVVALCDSGEEAVDVIRATTPDLVLLDIQMPEMDGFDVVRNVGADRMPPVIFVTAFDRFAVRAFDVSAVDYLLKPFDDERFTLALERAKRAVRQPNGADVSAQLAGLLRLVQAQGRPPVAATRADADAPEARRLVIRLPGRTLFVPYREIAWIEGADYCARVHVGRKSHLLRESLRSLSSRLDPHQFVRIHRSAIVNVARVRELRAGDGSDGVAVLDDGTELRVGRGRRTVLEQMLERDPAG